MRAFVVAAVVACVLAGAADAKERLPTGNGIEAVGSPSWPAVPAQLAKNIAKDAFAHDYPRVWSYLHPTYQAAVSREHWQACQVKHPAAPRNIRIGRVAVAQATELPVDLALLGRRNVQEIQVYVQYETPALTGKQVAILYTFWLKTRGKWAAVWLSDEFGAYKKGGCYLTPQGAPLY
jgi:hypothetical protein